MSDGFNIVEIIVVTTLGLLPVINPMSTAPLFMALTKDMESRQRRWQAHKACLFAFIVLAIFLLVGDVIIDFFGISLPSIRVSGGLVIAVIGFRMLFPKAADQAIVDRPSTASIDYAISPLAIPSLSGPGSIAVVIGMSAGVPEGKEVAGFAALLLSVAVVLFTAWIAMMAAGRIVGFVGSNLIDGVTKIMGFILIALAVQFIGNGVSAFFNI